MAYVKRAIAIRVAVCAIGMLTLYVSLGVAVVLILPIVFLAILKLPFDSLQFVKLENEYFWLTGFHDEFLNTITLDQLAELNGSADAG